MESKDCRPSFQSQGRLVEVSKVTDQGQVKLTKRVVLSKFTISTTLSGLLRHS